VAVAWLSNLIGGGGAKLVESIGSVIDNLHTSESEKAEAKVQLGELERQWAVEQESTYRKEIGARERVMVAELTQGDQYTKRARPTVVYAGLVAMVLNEIMLPWVAHFTGQVVPMIELPTAFWAGWSGIVATWVVSRTAERRGVTSSAVRMVTGGQPSMLASDDRSA